MASYLVTATFPDKTEITYTVGTENLLESEAIANFKQFHAEQCSKVDLTYAQFRCFLNS